MNTSTPPCKIWSPQNSPRGIIQIIPNNTGNSVYDNFAIFLSGHGYLVICTTDIPDEITRRHRLPVFLIRHDDGRQPWPNTDIYTACVAIHKRKEYKNPLVKIWSAMTDGFNDCACPDKPCLIISNGTDILKTSASVSKSLYQKFGGYNINHLTVVMYPYAKNDMMQDENWPNAQHEILRFVNQATMI